jgi:hypothetical protein
MPAAHKKFRQEMQEALPATIFFLLSFNLINFTERLMLEPYHLKSSAGASYLAASLGALLLGKIILLFNHLDFMDRFIKKPLIYSILWKSLIYGLLIIIFRIAEDFFHLLMKGEGPSFYHLTLQKMTSPVFWAIQIWVWMLFVLYIVASAFTRVFGKDKIKQKLFGARSYLFWV